MIKKSLLLSCVVLIVLNLCFVSASSQVWAAGSIQSLKKFAGEWTAAKSSLREEPYLKLYSEQLLPRIMQYLGNNLEYWQIVQGKWELVSVNSCSIDDTGLGMVNFTYHASRNEGTGRVSWEVTRTFYLRYTDGRWKIVGWGDRSERWL